MKKDLGRETGRWGVHWGDYVSVICLYFMFICAAVSLSLLCLFDVICLVTNEVSRVIGRSLSLNLLVHNLVRGAWGWGAQQGCLIIPDHPRERQELEEIRFDCEIVFIL